MTRNSCTDTRWSCAVCAFAVLMLFGCAPLPDRSDESARQVFSVALETLDDRYIDPIAPDRIMLSGLKQLSLIDDQLVVSRTPESVILTYDGAEVSERPAPATHNIDEWADLGARVIEDARQTSAAVAAYEQEKLFEQIFHGFVDGLDRYSRYLPPDDARNSRASREGFGGIGIRVGRVNGEFIVDTLFPDRPAIRAGCCRSSSR